MISLSCWLVGWLDVCLYYSELMVIEFMDDGRCGHVGLEMTIVEASYYTLILFAVAIPLFPIFGALIDLIGRHIFWGI